MTELLPNGVNGVVHARDAIVPLVAVPTDQIDTGSPRQGLIEIGTVGGSETGIWELRGGAVLDTEVDEVFVVIAGNATIELLDEGRTVEVKTGDVMRLVAGTRTRWTVPDRIRKIYIASE